MSFSELSEEKLEEISTLKEKLNWTMYMPQIVLLVIVFTLGVYMPEQFANIISMTTIGLK